MFIRRRLNGNPLYIALAGLLLLVTAPYLGAQEPTVSAVAPQFAALSSDFSFDLRAASGAFLQPPPRRYGRPNYSDKRSNPDGSPKYTFFGGAGASLPIGNTHAYETPGYAFQAGAGRNFNQTLGVLFQFDYDHFGLQAATLANELYIANYCTPSQIQQGCTATVSGLDGNNHVWDFTLDPTLSLATKGSNGAYLIAGGGFYHKVTNFIEPQTAEQCDQFGCQYYAVEAAAGEYTSNAGGVNAGIGLTRKLSQFSNQRVYVEARYVVIFNQQRMGVTAENVSAASPSATDFYPANSNRTTYVPVTVGVRF